MSSRQKARIRLVTLIGELGRGGSERQLYLLLCHLDSLEFERHVIVFNRSCYDTYEKELQQAGVSVWQVPKGCSSVRGRLLFVRHLLRELKADIVHSWTVHDNPYAGIGGKLARVPVCWGSLRGSLFSPGLQALPRVYRYLSIWGVSRIVVNSTVLLSQLTAQNYPSSRILLLPNCVELKRVTQAPDLSDLGIGADQRVVALVGNLRRVKNHNMFVQAMAQVLPHFPDVRALIVGQPIAAEPELPQEIQQAICALGLRDRILLAGFRADVPELMHRLAVFCLTSRSEGSPNAILEAMAAGCPVVATGVGGIPEIVADEVNGFTVEPDDVTGFARAVARLLEDKALSSRMGREGRKTVLRKYECNGVARRLTRAYQAACHG